MHRSLFGAATLSGVSLLVCIVGCRGTAVTAGVPQVAPAPTTTTAGRGGGGGRPSAVDTTRYVRTTPPSDPIIKDMWEE
ncbi:MAG TPA: hypothetical protein VH080_07235, partial [Gemmatimonadaceae bacterium]|nr:hypothetical protein [Gemmatimonadaceae bacterium]